MEGSESRAEAARREATEEVGSHPRGDIAPLARTRRLEGVPLDVAPIPVGATAPAVEAPPSPPLVPLAGAPTVVDFTTYVQRVDKPFEVVLSPEHSAHVWASVYSPPLPLHPGVQVAIDRLDMDELGVAEAIRDGRLTSGQRFHGMSLFAMRITGTGTAYRRGRREYVFRSPDIYLNERFLQRCSGLQVIMEHPEKTNLNSAEFQDRTVGNIMLAYIVGDEVWGIAKIYDDTTVKMLENHQLSTSPSVVFRNPSEVNTRVTLDGGEVLLIEGEPTLLDHLAICRQGVWDKGGEPRGVAFETIGDEDMTDEEKAALAAAEKAKKDADEKKEQERMDAEAGEKLDKVLSCLDSVSARMDAYDQRQQDRRDAEEDERRAAGDKEQVAKDKARRDADEKREFEERAEKDKKDAEERERKDAEVRSAIQKVQDALPKVQSDEDLNAIADAQMRADAVFTLHGKSASRPLPGETLISYRRRTASKLKEYSAKWKDIDLGVISDEAAFTNIEASIYADAEAAGHNPADVPRDELRSFTRRDSTGRSIVSFQGRPGAWLGTGQNRRRLLGIRNS